MTFTSEDGISGPLSPLPPTVIVVHPREKRRKCTVAPLRGEPGFDFRKFPEHPRRELEGYIRLGLDGPVLTKAEGHRGLLILDGTWRLVERMAPAYRDIPMRSLLPWQSAYPRQSKVHDDPTVGLATVEALFAAYFQMGRSTEGILDSYHWEQEFLELNRELMESIAEQNRSL